MQWEVAARTPRRGGSRDARAYSVGRAAGGATMRPLSAVLARMAAAGHDVGAIWTGISAVVGACVCACVCVCVFAAAAAAAASMGL